MHKARKEAMKEKKQLDYAKDILISLLGGYSITFLGIVVLAMMLLFLSVSENVVDAGVIVVYIFSCLISGIIAGKRIKYKKYLWGLFCGILYFLILFLISLAANQSISHAGGDLVTVFFLCAGSGTLGGMIS